MVTNIKKCVALEYAVFLPFAGDEINCFFEKTTSIFQAAAHLV